MSWEVPTMRSATSYFNKTVFLHDIKRFWPLTAGYALIWLLMLPLQQLTDLSYQSPYLSKINIQHDALNVAVGGGWLTAYIFGILFAMAVFSYLTNARATNGLHALSARRETLYVTHYLAGLLCQIGAQVLALVLSGLVLASHGAFDARVFGLSLLGTMLPTLHFYSFGVLCMIFTGQILAAPVFYGVLSVLAAAMEELVYNFAGNFLYGWYGRGAPLSWFSEFSPIYKLAQNRVGADYLSEAVRNADGTINEVVHTGPIINGLRLLWVYAAVGLVFAVLGLLIYRRRHSEATGTTVAIYWARPIFKYSVTFCAAFALGQLLYHMFFGRFRANGAYSLGGTLACMAVAGLIGYFVAEMLLKKSFRVLKGGWQGALVSMAVLAAFGFALSFDLTGFEGYVPDVSRIESAHFEISVYIGGNHASGQIDDPSTLQLVTNAHRAMVDDKRRQQAVGSEWYRGGSLGDGSGTQAYGQFTVIYTLKDGRVVRRRYQPMAIYAEELGSPSTLTAALTALYNDPDVTLMRTLGRSYYGGDTDPRKLPDLKFTGGEWYAYYWDEYASDMSRETTITPDEAETLYHAALRDVEAGRVVNSLFAADSEFYGELQLYATYDAAKLDASRTIPSTRAAEDVPADGREPTAYHVMVSKEMTETIAALRLMGIDIP